MTGWLFVLSAVSFLDRTNISIAGIQISQEFGLTSQQLGWVFSAFLVGYAGFQVVAGWLSAKFGPRLALAIGAVWWALSTILVATLHGSERAIWFLLALRFSLGIGESITYPAASQFVAQWIPGRERGRVNGLIFAGVGAGSGLTPPLLTWLIATHGWRSSFWFSGVVAGAAGLTWWLIARDTPRQHPWVNKEGITVIESTSPTGVKMKTPWRAMMTRRDIYALMLAYFGFGYTAWIFFSWFYLYMAQTRGLNLKASARFVMLPFLCMTVFCLFGGVVSDRLTARFGSRRGRCWLAAAALAMTSVFLVMGASVKSAFAAGVILAFGAGALYVSQSSYWSVAADIGGPNSGVLASLVNMAGQLGGAVTASLTPWVAQRFGWVSSFAVAAVLAVVAGGCWLTVDPDIPLQQVANREISSTKDG